MAYTIGNLRVEVDVNNHLRKSGVDWQYIATKYVGGTCLSGRKDGHDHLTIVTNDTPRNIAATMYEDAFYRISSKAQESANIKQEEDNK